MPRLAPPKPTRAAVVHQRLAALGWTQTDLASALGVSPQRIYAVLSGRQSARGEIWSRIAVALGLPLPALGARRAAEGTRPAAVLELVRHSPGDDQRDTLVPFAEPDEAMAARLGLLPREIALGDLAGVIEAAAAQRVAVLVRSDWPPRG